MSSTKRGYNRHKWDYYVTPIEPICEFIEEFWMQEPAAFSYSIFDPAAGGDAKNPMSYPTALDLMGVPEDNIFTMDIRQDSLAELKGDYLKLKSVNCFTIITNPPFDLAVPFIRKALDDVKAGGFVIMLLRLNFLGSKERRQFWAENMPKYIYVHHRRMSFTGDGNTDSIEYAHFIWQKGVNPEFPKLKLI